MLEFVRTCPLENLCPLCADRDTCCIFCILPRYFEGYLEFFAVFQNFYLCTTRSVMKSCLGNTAPSFVKS